jgi:outer membrane protein assembly factor BamE (lipoprotein component of BamABCDE complex)
MPKCILSTGLAASARLHRRRSWFTGFAPSRKAGRNSFGEELSLQRTNCKGNGAVVANILVALAPLALAACSSTMETLHSRQTFTQGYVIDQEQLDLVPVGSSREQVLLALGSPSTRATFDNEAFYYISQKRVRNMAFQNPHIVDQTVVAIYFGPDDRVTKVAKYGLKDGKVFDFVSRTTPTGGKETTFIGQMLTGLAGSPNLTQGAGPTVGRY